MVFKNFINLKGGVLLNKEWQSNPEGALFYFINNCTKVKIIFDTSVSCVCYKFYDLSQGITSPYISVRSTNLEQPVTSILFKIGLISNSYFGDEYVHFERSKHDDQYKSKIQAVTIQTVTEEIEAQHDVYIKSSSLSSESPLEAICPGIICYSLDINFDSKKFIFDMIFNKLEQRDGGIGPDKKYKISDSQVTKNLQNVKNNITIIVMEFMDGYENLSEFYYEKRKLQIFSLMHHYELYKLGNYGYLHLDSHLGNVMINPNYPYFTNDTNSDWIGKALIIDFGRIQNITQRGDKGKKIVENYSKNTFGGLYPSGQIISSHYRNRLDRLRATMAASFLSTLDEEKKKNLLLLFGGHRLLLNLKQRITQKSEKMIQDEKESELRAREDKRKEAERKEAERREAERKEAERKEAERRARVDKTMFYTAIEKNEDIPKAREEAERRAREESAQEIYYSALTTQKEPTSVLIEEKTNKNIGESAYIKATGNVPSASPIHNSFNLWNWAHILIVNAVEQGAVGKIIELALNKGGNGDNNCPNLSIDINNIPKCFKNQKEFRDMALILHPDQNNNCSNEEQSRAVEKFKKLNSNKQEQINMYGEINENTYDICMSSDNSNMNIKKESEELEFLKNNQEKMDSIYLESMKGKEISKNEIDKINFIFNLCNEKGEKNINEINNIFETIMETLYEVHELKNKIYDSVSQSISDDNINVSKIKIENLKKNVTQKIKEYRDLISSLLRENGINIESESENLLITCIIDVTFRNYLINIETLNNAINYIDGLINIKNGNKMNILNICFGIPQNLQITQNGGNQLTTINNNNQITNVFNQNVPLYGLKYELATTPLISLIKKYKIGTFNIANLNITSEQFNNNITNMFNKPFEFKNIPVTGGRKISKQKLIKHNKNNNNTKRIRKNNTKRIRKNKTKRRY